ncbi:glycosyltransferase [Ralstonia soli]|uniref:Glycosyltransferase n=1 Tax=Ralstonia soli TaxID=2953896 RepID=A0ABT1AJK1_9RALS|nr:glycosyltransferase [Ralstonia soli]MCO5398479.1 glycosyltransferase [Ralstonia soli]
MTSDIFDMKRNATAKRVLHLIPSFGSGGAERQLSLLAPELARQGVECHVGYFAEGPNLDRLRNQPGVTLHRLAASSTHDPAMFLRVLRLIRNVRPQLVQTWVIQMDVVGGAMAYSAGVPHILSERSAAQLYQHGWKSRARAWLGRRAAAVIANSQGGIDYWHDVLGDTVPTYVIRNCVTPTVPGLAWAGSGRSPEAGARVLFAGRLSEEKNVDQLVEALIRVVAARPGLTVDMFGEGPLRERLQARIDAAGAGERIVMHGFTSNLAGEMARADITISVSSFEGNPNVVLEAAAIGCPLVISEIPAHREFLGDDDAWYVNQTDVASIEAGLTAALNDPARSAAKAASASSRLKGASVEALAAHYRAAYEEVLTARHAGRRGNAYANERPTE